MAYAIGMLLVGGIIDKFGTKKGYAFSLFGWSLAAIGHAFAKGPFGFGVARAALRVPEAETSLQPLKLLLNGFPKKNVHWLLVSLIPEPISGL